MLIERDEKTRSELQKKGIELEQLRQAFMFGQDKIMRQQAQITSSNRKLRKLETVNKKIDGLMQREKRQRQHLKENKNTIKTLERDIKAATKNSIEVQEMRNELEENNNLIQSLKLQSTQTNNLRKQHDTDQRKITKLKKSNKELVQQLKEEKAASRMTIGAALKEADEMMLSAHALSDVLRVKELELEHAKQTMEERHKLKESLMSDKAAAAVRNERVWSSRQLARGEFIGQCAIVFDVYACESKIVLDWYKSTLC